MAAPSTTPAPEQAPTTEARKPRPSVASRRFGYAVAVAVNALLVFLIYVEPGWRVLPFLTEDATAVIALVVLSILVSIAVNLIWIAYDPLWLRSLGELITTIVAIVVISRFLAVFPFDFAADSPWELVVRIFLIVGLVGSIIGVVAHLVTLLRRLSGRADE
jgi:hypothetical protein